MDPTSIEPHIASVPRTANLPGIVTIQHSETDLIRFFDSHIHPEYLNCQSVLKYQAIRDIISAAYRAGGQNP
jgi:hypothetical protein